ncbi:MAG: carboxypeptidase-like regulatory domain-containing protein [Bryobacteraceae bacterium]
MRKHFLLIALVALLSGLLTTHVFAQITATASVQGRVLDKSGAAIPGAEVKVSNKATGFARTMMSSAEGIYNFDLLPAGVYEIRVASKGFATSSIQNVELGVGQTATQDATSRISPISPPARSR